MNFWSRWLALAMLAALTTGCARVPMAPHQPSLDSLQVLRQVPMAPVGVGAFALAAGKDAAIDKSVTARAVTVFSPNQDSFAQYLREALIVELKSAGKLDESSATQVHGWLTTNELSASGVTIGTGALGADFAVRRGGRELYRREIVERAEWKSSFIGVEAIPEAINQYDLLYRKLVVRLVSDPEFQAATKAP
jgi:hypothetical protein